MFSVFGLLVWFGVAGYWFGLMGSTVGCLCVLDSTYFRLIGF